VYRDFAHFMGDKKAWMKTPCKKCGAGHLHWPHNLWFDELAELNEKFSIGLDVEHFMEKHMPQMKESPLGYIARYSDHKDKVMMLNNDKKPDGEDGSDTNNDKITASSQSPADSVANTAAASLPVVGSGKGDPFTVAYAVSFIKCGDFQTHSAGLTDASLVLRHSIHKISRRNPDSGSKYDYKMYAIVHRDAEACSQILNETGFEVLVVEPPVKQEEIQGEFLRKMIHREWCCGADEFIKLYAYTLPEEIVVQYV
jgi:hypothetical protein